MPAENKSWEELFGEALLETDFAENARTDGRDALGNRRKTPNRGCTESPLFSGAGRSRYRSTVDLNGDWMRLPNFYG
jgi:hypothetical protein